MANQCSPHHLFPIRLSLFTYYSLFIYIYLFIMHRQYSWSSHLWKWKVKVTRLCLTLCNPMDYTVHGIVQARILEGVAVPFSSGSSWPRNRTGVSCIAGGFFTSWATILWISSKMSFEISANSGLCRKRNFGKCSSSEVRMTQDKSTTDSAFFLWFRKGANIYWIPFMGQGPC